MKEQERIRRILDLLDEHYSVQKKCWLDYKNAWQLLIATILSAQCTDARVNMVTKDLFRKYPDLYAFASADLEELEKDIHSTGFYHSKARNIIAASKILVQQYNAQIPSDIEELTKLPGVGRKTANLLLGDIYGKPAIVADTHCIRISNRLGLCESKTPEKVEFSLREVVTPETSSDFCHRLVMFGREVCSARSPRCGECPFEDMNCNLE